MKRQIEIDRRTWTQRLIGDARCNDGFYTEPPIYRQMPRRPDTWLARRMAEISLKEKDGTGG